MELNVVSNPLDKYRKSASFDWKKLKVEYETEEIIKYKQTVLEKFKLIHPNYAINTNDTFDQIQEKSASIIQDTHLREEYKRLISIGDVNKMLAFYDVLSNYCSFYSGKFFISTDFFAMFIANLGSEENHKILEHINNGKYSGCVCMTEIGHGSATKEIRTQATYDSKTKNFILYTPDFEAAKCWSGNLAKSATHAVVFAQLYTENGDCCGVHAFIVQIRDEKTHLPLPNLLIGNMGVKSGLVGVDNGILIFKNFAIPQSNLLNKFAKINDDGEYEIIAKSNPFIAALMVLSLSRTNMMLISSVYMTKGITIALRYSAVRKQFRREDNGEELAILEYPLHQYRLIPYLSSAHIFKNFSDNILIHILKINAVNAETQEDDEKVRMEIHAITAAAKVEISWTTQNALQEFREACGGHGYLKATRLGDLRNDNDAGCTYEGDNNVLLQQSSNWLLKQWNLILENKTVSFPLNSINFLNNAKSILSQKFNKNIQNIQVICAMYEWLICYLLKNFHANYSNIEATKSSYDAKQETVIFFAKPLSKAYIQYFMLRDSLSFKDGSKDPAIRYVLEKLFSLYGLYNLEKFSNYFYQGGYMCHENDLTVLQNSIISLCRDLKSEAIALVDVIAPDDFLLDSVLGYSDGQVYKRLEELMLQDNTNKIQSKL